MIYTCTLNPAIDYKIKIDSFDIGKLNRFDEGVFRAGGKGINVSIALAKLGIDSISTGFLGGFTGAFIASELTDTYHLKHEFINVEPTTRMNVKIMSKTVETELNHDGNNISQSEKEKLIERIRLLGKDDLLVCGGSTAKGHPNLYQEIAQICYKNHVKLIMDTPGNYLSLFLDYQPYLIKPNLVELEAYFNQKISGLDQIIDYGKKLIASGAQLVLISMGSDGSVLISKDAVYQASKVTGIVKTTVGAGDSMVAGFIKGIMESGDIKKAYQSGVAAASATTFGDELVDPNLYSKFLSMIQIKEIK